MTAQAKTDKDALAEAVSVSAAVRMARGALDKIKLKVLGEVSSVSTHPNYRAAYFDIKDTDEKKNAVLHCVMWNERYKDSGVELEAGQRVEVEGHFTVWVAKGDMEFDVSSLSLAGEGELRMKVAALAKKLEKEGLTAQSRKRPLPLYPERVGVVTSPRGAAVQDVRRTMKRRFPVAELVIAGVPVEGEKAAAGIIEGINCVANAGVEVVLVVRGGGSFENLMPFNDEALARTIASCPVPVVTGIGHEIDTTIADLVSDRRASTPTAAAEEVSPSPEELAGLLSSRGYSLSQRFLRRLELSKQRIQSIADRPIFADEMALTGEYARNLDALSERLGRALPNRVARDTRELDALNSRLVAALPHRLATSRAQEEALEQRLLAAGRRFGAAEAARLESARRLFIRSGGRVVDAQSAALSAAAARLEDLSPLKTVARGFAVVRKADGTMVKSAGQVQPGDGVDVRVSDGTISCLVQKADKAE